MMRPRRPEDGDAAPTLPEGCTLKAELAFTGDDGSVSASIPPVPVTAPVPKDAEPS
jgi:hypothetical protein